jgi:nicotinamidase-related amidase
MLNDFLTYKAPLHVPEGRKIIANIERKISLYREENLPIIYVCDTHDINDKEFEVWSEHCIINTYGAEIIDELKPKDNEIIVRKTRYSGFYKTNLEEILDKHKIDILEITGILTHICVLYTVADATFRDYHVIVTKSCVASNDAFLEEFALKQMKEVHNITLTNE